MACICWRFLARVLQTQPDELITILPADLDELDVKTPVVVAALPSAPQAPVAEPPSAVPTRGLLCAAATAGIRSQSQVSSVSGPIALPVRGVEVMAQVSELQMCRHSHIVLSLAKSPSAGANHAASGAEIGVEVFATVFTVGNTTLPCVDVEAVNCTRYTRQLPVVFNERFSALVATFVPDPGAKHYMFTLQVSVQRGCINACSASQQRQHCCPLSQAMDDPAACVSTKILSPKGFEDRMPEPDIDFTQNRGLGYPCLPLFHLSVRASSGDLQSAFRTAFCVALV